MSCIRARSPVSPALALLALALAAVVLAVVTSPAAAASEHHSRQRLVVRGDATAVDGPCVAGVCPLTLADGRFRGTAGTDAYTAAFELAVGDAFPNGEGGICAPLRGRIVLGSRPSDRLVLAVWGDSCQDGAGPLPGASFTGLARFAVKRATGSYAGTARTGLASFTEDGAKHHRMTLIGRIAR
jgi:hypothetical protein